MRALVLAVSLLLASAPSGTRVLRDVPYGPDPQQRFDVYIPAGAHHAPVVFMVHGGGWRRGDKESGTVVENKMRHWTAQGFVFISVNNRLLPATPFEQAGDVARALATAQSKATGWCADPARFILMGHSAGAHLVALVSTQPAAKHLATVLLDSAALDVPRILESRHFRLYDEAFGADPAQWRAASPYHQLRRAIPPLLAVCSSRRADSCSQAHAFVEKARSLGTRASVLEESLSHRQINETLGQPGAYTAAVDAFLKSVL